MIANPISPEVAQLYSLVQDYSFDVDAYAMDSVIADWLREFDLIWVSHAITEALYQGRYKIVSIDQILRLWQRRGHPIRHFNREFETIILGQSLFFYPESQKTEENRALLPDGGASKDYFNPVEPEANGIEEQSSEGDCSLGLQYEPTTHSGEKASLEGSINWIENQSVPEPTDLTTWFNSDMPVPNFRSVAPSPITDMPHPEPIRPFVPRQEVSAMHQRLQAVVKARAAR